jgi:hypothetical protein
MHLMPLPPEPALATVIRPMHPIATSAHPARARGFRPPRPRPPGPPHRVVPRGVPGGVPGVLVALGAALYLLAMWGAMKAG